MNRIRHRLHSRQPRRLMAKLTIAAFTSAMLLSLAASAQGDDAAAIKALNTAWIHAYMTTKKERESGSASPLTSPHWTIE